MAGSRDLGWRMRGEWGEGERIRKGVREVEDIFEHHPTFKILPRRKSSCCSKKEAGRRAGGRQKRGWPIHQSIGPIPSEKKRRRGRRLRRRRREGDRDKDTPSRGAKNRPTTILIGRLASGHRADLYASLSIASPFLHTRYTPGYTPGYAPG